MPITYRLNPLAGRGAWQLSVTVLAIALLQGCAMSKPPRSETTLQGPDKSTIDRLQQQMLAESQKFLASQDALNKGLRKQAEPPELKPQAPKFDPLEGRMITVAMSRATISQVLAAFADSARINLVVDPAVIRGGQLSDMYLRDMSLREAFNEVLRVYDVAGEIKGNTLRVTLHEEKFFSLDFLNSATGMNIASGGNVFGNSSGGASGSNALSGNLTLTGTGGTKSDPYVEIENGVRAILGEDLRRSQQAATGSNSASTTSGVGSANGASAQNPTLQGSAGTSSNPFMNASLTPGVGAFGNNTLAEGNSRDSGFSLNKVSGSLYVKARPSKMRAVEKLVANVQNMLRKQVYIEAQLIDVQLSDNFSFGVNWNLLRNRLAATFGTNPLTLASTTSTFPLGSNALASTSLTIPAATIGSAIGAGLGVAFQGKNVSAVVNALEGFGNVQVLSNPNVQVRNGTPAIMAVGSSIRYVSSSSSTLVAPGGGASTSTSSVQTDSVFSGILVGVMPFMREDGRVELLINPMQTDVEQSSLALVTVNANNQVTLPVVNYKGITTTLNVGDGDVVLVGGLIDQHTTRTDSGAPGTSDVPLLGKLLGQTANTHSSRELVIVMRVHVL